MQSTNLSLVRGDDQDVGIIVSNPDGSYYNLSGCALTFTMRKNTYFDQILMQKNVTDHYGAVSGRSYITFTTGDTSNFDDTSYYYDIKLLSTGQKLTTLVYGNLNFYPR